MKREQKLYLFIYYSKISTNFFLPNAAMQPIFKILTASFVLMSLVSCGGGSDSGTNDTAEGNLQKYAGVWKLNDYCIDFGNIEGASKLPGRYSAQMVEFNLREGGNLTESTKRFFFTNPSCVGNGVYYNLEAGSNTAPPISHCKRPEGTQSINGKEYEKFYGCTADQGGLEYLHVDGDELSLASGALSQPTILRFSKYR
jgi:hypothetical protein